jgi:hypothetical protein
MGGQGPSVTNIISTTRVTRRQNGGRFIGGEHELRVIFQPQPYVSRGPRDCSGLLTFGNYLQAARVVNLTLVPVRMIKIVAWGACTADLSRQFVLGPEKLFQTRQPMPVVGAV